MFTGVIKNLAKITNIQSFNTDNKLVSQNSKNDFLKLTIESFESTIDVEIGQSISLNGICLTIIKIENQQLSFDISIETVRLTNIKDWFVGKTIHFEQALKFNARFDGHFVLGHIDTCLKVDENILLANNNRLLTISTKSLTKLDRSLIIKKGSIAIDGISLTINEVDSTQFSLMLIPHTIKKTNLGQLKFGDNVNVEFDVLARYTQNRD